MVKGQPADQAGLLANDIVVAIDHEPFTSSKAASDYIKSREGNIISFEVKRGKEDLTFEVHSNQHPAPDQGPTGIGVASEGSLLFSWYYAPWEGLKAMGSEVSAIVGGLGQLISGKAGLKDVGGPVRIAQLVGQAREMGFVYLLQLTIALSLSLAVLNILPFPALDGGRVLFLIIEKVRGKRNNQKIEQWLNTIGFMLLLLLMVVVTVHDISTIQVVRSFFQKIF